MRKNNFIKKLIHHPHFIPWVLFTFFTTVYFASTVGIMNSSDSPQYALTKALVEDQNIRIEKYSQWVFPDYALYKNRMYSLRTFGESLFMTPFYLLGKVTLPFTNFPYNGHYRGIDMDSKLESLTVLSDAIFAALSLVILHYLILKIVNNKLAAILTVITGGLGTLIWRYSSQMQRFAIEFFFLLASFYIFYKLSAKNHKKIKKEMIFLGLCLGCLILVDLSIVFICVLILLVTILLIFRKYKKNYLPYLFIPFFAPILILIIYNFSAFDRPITSPYNYHGTKPYYRNTSNYYSIPLIPSVITNLISNKPIPPSVFGNLWENTVFRENEGMTWASRLNYKGIFVQSPALILSLIGIIFIAQDNLILGLLIFILPTTYIIQTSKYIAFYGPNSYDTHYFLPAIPFLAIGLSGWIGKLTKVKHPLLAGVLWFFTGVLILISIYNGWYSNLINYAPHVTGEHRFSFEQLSQPFLASENIQKNFGLLFINTFPNIYNIHLLFIFYFPLFFVIYLFIFQRKFIVRRWKKVSKAK